MKILFKFLMISLFYAHSGFAQAPTKEHIVKKGETVYQIARIYKVSPKDILKLNPNAEKGIEINDTLILPKLPEAEANIDNTTRYRVKPGETKFGLSRKFGVSIAALESENPHIVNGLQAGHNLKISTPNNNAGPTNLKQAENSNVSGNKSHLVKKGETLFGISKANGLTVKELVNANSGVIKGVLQTGTVLQIPIENITIGTPYLVKKGDTKYGLSKKFNMTIRELETSNPQTKRMLLYGTTITIPETKASIVETEQNPLNTNTEELKLSSTELIKETIANTDVKESSSRTYHPYTIKSKETVYGLSKRAGMSKEEFLELNPQLKTAVNVGDIIKMPLDNIEASNNIKDKNIIPLVETSTYKNLQLTIDNTKTSNILLVIPFTESEFDAVELSNKDLSLIQDPIIRENFEIFRGAKIAIDSIKALGINTNIETVSHRSKIVKSSNASELGKFNAILLPFNDNDAHKIAVAVSNKNTPVITTYDESNKTDLNNLFEALPSPNLFRLEMLDFINSKNGNVIVISDKERSESESLIKDVIPSASFINLKKNRSFGEENLVSLLDKNRMNYVIYDSGKHSAFISVTNLLLKELSNFPIQLAVLEPSLIPNSEYVSQKRLTVLKMLYPSNNHPSIKDKGLFIDKYKSQYKSVPSSNVLFGFDVTFDTLLRMSQSKSFEATVVEDPTMYTSNKFEYKKNKLGRYMNGEVQILQYDDN